MSNPKILTSTHTPLNRPIVTNGDVLWPWVVSAAVRRSIEEASIRIRAVDVELLDRVLDAKNVLANHGRAGRR